MGAIRGRAAERAVSLACTRYKKDGRADIVKQATPMRKHGGTWKFARKSPIDFRGTIAGGKSIALEVKEHSGASFPLNESTLNTAQRNALDTATAIGGEVWLLIDLPSYSEAYAVEWRHVREFLFTPYRSSISLQWLRRFGLLCKESGRNTSNFRIWFLDRSRHPQHESAVLAEAAERLEYWRKNEKWMDLEESTVVPSHSARPPASKEERLAGIRDAIENGKWRKRGAR